MAILYSSDGQSVQVFDSYINDYLRQGYSTNLPIAYQSISRLDEHAIAPQLSVLTELTGSIDINSASIKILQSLPNIGVAIAKKIVENRPYSDLADLTNKINDIPWHDLRDKITLSVEVDKVDETAIAGDK